MINYEVKDEYIRVKWHKKELGRVYQEADGYHYRPRACGGKIRSEVFPTLKELKAFLEGED